VEVFGVMERILVGVDGSPASAAALGWAAGLAGRTGAGLVAACAFEPAEAELPPGRNDELRAEAADRLRDWVAAVPGLPVEAALHVDEGNPAEVLLDQAERAGADLVVVGTRGAGGFAGLHLGSVAHHLAHHTVRPLAIVPMQGAEPAPGGVVVGVDGSAGSSAAIAWIGGIVAAGGHQGPVVAVQAFEPFAEWVPASDRRGWRRRAEQDMARWLAPLRDVGADVRIVVDRDVHPVSAIERVVRDEGAGLVVVGTRGLGGFSGLRLGRVPIQLVHHLGRPVVMVPPAA
jgi:nucleotide-binding universal stress UspA family protein